jgi:hypothetical protein
MALHFAAIDTRVIFEVVHHPHTHLQFVQVTLCPKWLLRNTQLTAKTQALPHQFKFSSK